ncbi:MAG: methyltransferase domain-containing protein [Acidobacteria bacterium]|nr:methyltransferase domain-containing protein [Acidobacteriota bacterium]
MSLEGRFGRFVPDFVKRRLMRVETGIDEALQQFVAALEPGGFVLDAAAGEARHRALFSRHRYVGVDLAVGDAAWNYQRLDARANLERLPFPDETFSAAISIVTLEHLAEPLQVLQEIRRTLQPGKPLLLVAPQMWEVHQAPHDYYRYTRHGLEYLLGKAGFERWTIEPMGGYFTLLARRLMAALIFFQGGLRWLAFPLVAAAVAPAALLLPSLDGLDSRKDYTLAYVCIAR